MQNDGSALAPEKCFGSDQWAKYFGDVGAYPPLPDGVAEILEGPCPIWSGRRVSETHKLFLVPRTLDGVPVSLDLVGEIVQRPRRGHPTGYLYFAPPARADIGKDRVDAAHWCLMTKDVIPGSKSMDYQDQRRFMADLRDRLGIAYTLPSVVQAALCILTHYVETGERIFVMDDAEKTWTFTRCEEEVSKDKWAVAVGGFQPGGLMLYRSPDFLFDRHFSGVAGVRRV